MKYILSTILLVSVAGVLISEHKPSKISTETKKTAIDTSARQGTREESLPLSQDVKAEKIVIPDTETKDERSVAMEKEIREERKRYLGIIKEHKMASLPYELTAGNMQTAVHEREDQYDDAITNLVYGPNYGEYSRSMPRSYEFVAYLGRRAGYHMAVYRMASDVSDDIYPTGYFLATITDDGVVIGEMEIAGMESPEQITVATIDAAFNIVSSKVTQTWQYDPLEKGYKNNKVIKSEVSAKQTYRISGDGMINES